MSAVEPKAMPSGAEAGRSAIVRKSTISVVMSDHPLGSGFPALVDEPWKMAIERDRTAVAHPGRSKTDHHAPQHAPGNAGGIGALLDLQLHARAWQQPMARFDERTARRHVDQPHAVTGTNASGPDVMILERLEPAGGAPFGLSF